jgi:hypothetical protein
VIVVLQAETTAGTQVRLVPTALPAATVILFHVNPNPGLAVGQTVAAGTSLGFHIGSQTMSDIAIRIATPAGDRLVSYFDAMPDSVFAAYVTRGVGSRDALVISQASRDSLPLACSGEQFLAPGTIANWVDLN